MKNPTLKIEHSDFNLTKNDNKLKLRQLTRIRIEPLSAIKTSHYTKEIVL